MQINNTCLTARLPIRLAQRYWCEWIFYEIASERFNTRIYCCVNLFSDTSEGCVFKIDSIELTRSLLCEINSKLLIFGYIEFLLYFVNILLIDGDTEEEIWQYVEILKWAHVEEFWLDYQYGIFKVKELLSPDFNVFKRECV
jgi:hypothetical protein